MAVLRTVRAKLTTLVALSALAALAALPLLHWLMTRQLVDVVDDRVPDAMRGFELELADDVKDLSVGVRALASSANLAAALEAKDAAGAKAALDVWHDTYPEMGLVAFAADGKPLAGAGLPADAREGLPPKEKDALAQGATELRFLRRKGCALLPEPRPAFAIVRAVGRSGIVMACMTFDETYLANSTEKLGVELAVSDPEGKIAFTTKSFPRDAIDVWKGGNDLAEGRGRAWAVRRFVPKLFTSDEKRFSVIAALDVTDIRSVVLRNLAIAAGALVFAALGSVLVGARLARIMSRALGRINTALKKLEAAEYVHVLGVKTGDEIEDLATGFNTMVDGLRERDKLRTTLGKYLTQAVMEHVMAGEVELGGESLTVTVLFTDIRGFTTISESMKAQELVALLNEYFTEMVGIVAAEGGVVDKYIGDAIMAVFGAPVPKPDDARNAVRAAIKMRQALVKLNERLVATGRPALATGIGIHTGEVVAGNIGSEARMEYTVIGDAVNLASRLEGATKDVGVDILISEDTYGYLGGEFVVRPIRSLTVKGRGQAVMTYEVTGEVTATSTPQPTGG